MDYRRKIWCRFKKFALHVSKKNAVAVGYLILGLALNMGLAHSQVPDTTMELLKARLFALDTAFAYSLVPPDPKNRSLEQLVGDAYSTQYGILLVKEFISILRDSADKECLRVSGLDMNSIAFEDRGREILITDGIRVRKAYDNAIDNAKFDRLLTAAVGKTAEEEIALLKMDSDVQQLMKIAETKLMAHLAESLAEYIKRYALLRRLGLVRGISPYENAKTYLLNASERAQNHDEIRRYLDEHSNPKIERWVTLSEAWRRAWAEAIDYRKLHTAITSNPQLEEDLRKICILPRVKAKASN